MTEILWWLSGAVIAGDGRGRRLGFPTANLDVVVDPANCGVYAAWVRIGRGGSWLPGTVSVGSNPTFRPRPARARAEVHLHDYQGNLYGSLLQAALVRQLRAMEVCASVTELIERSRHDVATSREVLREAPPPAGMPAL